MFGLRWPLQLSADRCGVVLGQETREAYLLRKHPEFAAVVVANSLVPEDAVLLVDDRFGAIFIARPRTRPDAGGCCWTSSI